MTIIQKLILRECLIRTTIVLLAILSLFIVFDSLDSFRGMIGGKNRFAVLLWEIVIKIPDSIYELLPLAVLLGSIWAISLFAKSSELTVMRISGYLIKNLIALMLIFGFVIGLFGILVDEFVSFYTKQLHTQIINPKKSDQLSHVWTRYQQTFIRIDKLNQNHATGILRINLAKDFKSIESIIKAKSGEYIITDKKPDQNSPNYWLLNDVEQITLNPQITNDSLFAKLDSKKSIKDLLAQIQSSAYQVKYYPQKKWTNAPEAEFFVDQDIEPKDLKLSQLIPLYQFNLDNFLRFEALAVVMWKKINYPLVIALMAIIGIPFCLKTGRQIEATFRILVGVIIGIVFFVFQGIFANLGILALPPLFSVLSPILLFFILTLLGVWWAQKR